MGKIKIDKVFLIISLLLVVVGLFIFSSAALGLLATDGSPYTSVVFNQVVLGILFGLIAMMLATRVDYKFWRKYSFYFFLASLLLTVAVFIPGIGFEHGGATRWIALGGLSFQPSEFLKIGFIMYLAAWLSGVKDKVSTFKYGMVPFLIISAIVGVVLLLQPDTDTFFIIFITGASMFFVAGGKLRHLAGLALIGIICIVVLAFSRPYVMSRIKTFFHPANNPQSSGYQIQQSLIAIGSGGMFGRGLGQSIQKFNLLPEPIGDSIFAVAGEEFGFAGCIVLIFLFCVFAVRGFRIAYKSPDAFSRLLCTGIVILIISESYLNIGAMLGVFPLSGLPLPFVSHGGSAMFATLGLVGIILQVSKHQKS